MNPCPCGHLGDPRGRCRRTPRMVPRYRPKVWGPLLDRIDTHIEVPPVEAPDLLVPGGGGRDRQRERFRGLAGLYANGQMGARDERSYCQAEETGMSMLRAAMARLGLSARAFHRVLKIVSTVADLEACEIIKAAHVAEAIGYRGLDRAVRESGVWNERRCVGEAGLLS